MLLYILVSKLILICATVQDQVTCLHFIAHFAKCANRNVSPCRPLNKAQEEKLNAHISQMAGTNLIEFAVWPAIFLSIYTCLLSIYTWCGTPAFLTARHTTVCLDHLSSPPLALTFTKFTGGQHTAFWDFPVQVIKFSNRKLYGTCIML